jgi:enoyl-CoA hydratase
VSLVRYDVADAIATVTLDSPHNRNALSARLVTELDARLADAGADHGVRAVVLTHTGTTFCAGADLAEAGAGGVETGARRLLGLFRRLVELPKPVVGRVAGHVRAGGTGLVGACDIVVATPGSTFAFTEARLGLAAAIVSLTTLPRLDPRAAGRYLLTAEAFDGLVAERIGLVTAAAEDLEAELAGYLTALRAASPQGLAESKHLVTEPVRRALAERGDAMVDLSARLFASADGQEGVRSFLERRPPAWAIPAAEAR